MQFRAVLGVLLGSVSAACGSQATPEYYGESLGAAYGLVTNPGGVDVAQARVIANWGWYGGMFGPSKTHADVQGGFPANFSLNFFEMPPEAVLFTPADQVHGPEVGPQIDPRARNLTRAQLAAERGEYYDFTKESRIAIAHVLAVREGSSTEHDVGEVLGGDEHHAILYVESDIQPGTYGEAMFQGLPKAGYHLLEVAAPTDPWEDLECQAQAQNVEEWKACKLHTPVRLAGRDTKLNVRLVNEESELQFTALYPQWTPFGVDLPDPNAKPNCDADNPMTQFIPQCQ